MTEKMQMILDIQQEIDEKEALLEVLVRSSAWVGGDGIHDQIHFVECELKDLRARRDALYE